MSKVLPLVSVIIPVYNTEKYLPECVDSILNQTYDNLDIILVNDGSKDKSGEICDQYAKQDKRIKAFHQENKGVTKARALGVDQCSGDYLCFVDSDDSLKYDAIETMIGKFRPCFDVVSLESEINQVLSPVEYAVSLIKGIVNWSLCSKLYRRSVFNTNVFVVGREIVAGEDFLTQLMISNNLVGHIAYFTESKYVYRVNAESTMSQHEYNYNYECLMLQEVRHIASLSTYDVSDALFIHELNVLGGFIAHQLPVDYKGEWAQMIYKGAKTHVLTIRQKIVAEAVENRLLRFALVAEKRVKKMIKHILMRRGTR